MTHGYPLVRSAVSGFVLGMKVINEDVYEILYEMAEQGGDGIGNMVRYGIKDPKVRTKLSMMLARSALHRDSQASSTYKPFLYPAMAHIEECRPHIQTAVDARATAKREEIEKADKKEKKKLGKGLEAIEAEKVVLQQRADELGELAMLTKHFASAKPSQEAVDDLCGFYVKRPWGTQNPHLMGETSYLRPLYDKPVGLVRDVLLRWGKPAVPMIRRFQQQDKKTLGPSRRS